MALKSNHLLSSVKSDSSFIFFTASMQHGASHGVWQYLLMRLNAYLIDMLGMAPGGEFRAAAQEVSNFNTRIILN
ncbi:unnamed protein product [Echinostoma caproni]|uniref:Uncharacterized protein n=1 Tax=Echinostoma caproni TaxID=27848 RepID=A0A3P8I8D1_9TREM|nr:unnamed protein product [Echinostoma caproni]